MVEGVRDSTVGRMGAFTAGGMADSAITASMVGLATTTTYPTHTHPTATHPMVTRPTHTRPTALAMPMTRTAVARAMHLMVVTIRTEGEFIASAHLRLINEDTKAYPLDPTQA